ITFMLTIILGCSKHPSERDAEAWVKRQIEEEKGVAELIFFKKIDGEEKEWMGSKMYVMRCETKIKFLKDFGRSLWLPTIKKGHIAHNDKFYIWFRKTEKGWIPEGMSNSPDYF
ncbi:MAG: hypothetical protein ACUVWV_16545, partial [Thermodesulfobacteriota bacterium]